MKTLLALLFVLLASIASAQVVLEGNKEGAYRIKDTTQEWAASDITAEPEALPYIDYFSRAISSPGKAIVVRHEEAPIKLKLMFKKLVEVENDIIIYDQSAKTINFQNSKAYREMDSPLIPLAIMSLIFMGMANVIFLRKKMSLMAFVAAIAATVFVVFEMILAVEFSSNPHHQISEAVVTLAAAASFSGANIALAKEFINFKFVSFLFYFCMAVHITLLFL